MNEFNPRFHMDSEHDHHLEGEPMIERMKKHLDEHTKERKAADALRHAWLFEIIGGMFIVAAWLSANEGTEHYHDSGRLVIVGIVFLAIGGLFGCRHAWLTTPPPEKHKFEENMPFEDQPGDIVDGR